MIFISPVITLHTIRVLVEETLPMHESSHVMLWALHIKIPRNPRAVRPSWKRAAWELLLACMSHVHAPRSPCLVGDTDTSLAASWSLCAQPSLDYSMAAATPTRFFFWLALAGYKFSTWWHCMPLETLSIAHLDVDWAPSIYYLWAHRMSCRQKKWFTLRCSRVQRWPHPKRQGGVCALHCRCCVLLCLCR